MNLDLAALLQSLHLPDDVVATVMHITSTLFALVMLVRTFRGPIVKSLTWAADRFDDMAGHGREDGAMLLAIVDSRIYRVIWFLTEYLFRLHLPTRASLEARWKILETHEALNSQPTEGVPLGALAGLLLLIPFLFTACGSPKLAAFRSVSAVAHTVDASMNAWGDWVRAGKATPDSEARVEAAYVKYQAAMAVVKSGVVAAEGQPADSPAYLAVPAALSAAASDLIALIDQFAPPEKR